MRGEAAADSNLAADLRQEFDNAFRMPITGLRQDVESLILMRVGGEALAVRTLEISGVARCKQIVPIPTRVRDLLGISSLRGTLLPVYDLAPLLGLAAGAGERSWLVLANAETPLALLFDEFEGQVAIEPGCLYQEEGIGALKHLRLVARVGSANRAVIDVPGLVEEIRKRAGRMDPVKE